jgi:hypothetical protein
MQRLDVLARLFPSVLDGTKTSTIRFQECRIHPGSMAYWCDGDSTRVAIVWVTRCTDMPLCEVARFQGMVDEWPDQFLLDGMRAIYPTIKLEDAVQVIEHLGPEESRAYLADEKS